MIVKEELARYLKQAIRSFQGEQLDKLLKEAPLYLQRHLSLTHTVPSPSSVLECRLKQWLTAKKHAAQPVPLNRRLRQLQGTLNELLWLSLFRSTKYKVAQIGEKGLTCGPYMVAFPDALLEDDYLVEFKSVTGVGYRKLLESYGGVEAEEPYHYMQVQLYLFAAKRRTCVYLASPPDPSLLQAELRQKRGLGYELPPFYLEFIEKDEETVNLGLERAELITADIEKDTPPPREYSGLAHDLDGHLFMPCGFCEREQECNIIYRHGEGIEIDDRLPVFR